MLYHNAMYFHANFLSSNWPLGQFPSHSVLLKVRILRCRRAERNDSFRYFIADRALTAGVRLPATAFRHERATESARPANVNSQAANAM
jgi:hypothetical protein